MTELVWLWSRPWNLVWEDDDVWFPTWQIQQKIGILQIDSISYNTENNIPIIWSEPAAYLDRGLAAKDQIIDVVRGFLRDSQSAEYFSLRITVEISSCISVVKALVCQLSGPSSILAISFRVSYYKGKTIKMQPTIIIQSWFTCLLRFKFKSQVQLVV